MNLCCILLMAEDEAYVNVTPTLLRFLLKFLAIFAVVAVVGVLTPWMAKKVDAFRSRHAKTQTPEDPRCAAVKGIYDADPPQEETPAADASPAESEEQT